MARKTLKDLRAEADAAEALGLDDKKPAKKKAAKKKKAAAKRTRKAAKVERKRLSWGIFSGTLKEEARFAFDQREEAEAKLAALLARGRRLYFLQPIKESLSAATASAEEDEPVEEDEDAPKAVDPDAEPDDDDEPEVEEADPPFAGEDDDD